MSTIKKMIFLTNNEKSKCMATVKIEKALNKTLCTIKTYKTIPDGKYLIGIKNDKEITKHDVSIQEGKYSFFLPQSFNITDSLGCVLVEVKRDEITPLLWGNEKEKYYKDIIVYNMQKSVTNLQKNNLYKNKPSPSPTTNTHVCELNENIKNKFCYTTDTPTNTTNEYNYTRENISPNEFSNNSHHAPNIYTPHNFSQISLEKENIEYESDIAVASTQTIPPELFESENEDIDAIIDQHINDDNYKHKFYEMIKNQLDEIFDTYPPEKTLSQLIPNSKWAKLDTSYDNKQYVVGIIYQDDDEKYICYGVPGNFHIEPPMEMKKYSQWLPTDTQDPYNNGYWVMYQDVDTGENILFE